MNEKDLEQKIKELEKRIKQLEDRPYNPLINYPPVRSKRIPETGFDIPLVEET